MAQEIRCTHCGAVDNHSIETIIPIIDSSTTTKWYRHIFTCLKCKQAAVRSIPL